MAWAETEKVGSVLDLDRRYLSPANKGRDMAAAGERLLNNRRGSPKGYEVIEFACSPNVMYVHFTRTA